MFVLNFNDTATSLVNHILTEIQSRDMLGQVYSVYHKTDNFDISCSNYKVNTVVLDLSESKEDDLDIDDLMLSILDANVCPVVIPPKDEDFKELFLECVDIYKIPYLDYESITLLGEPKLNNILDFTIIDEIFNGNTGLNKLHTPNRYTVNVTVTQDEIIVNGKVSPIYNFNWENLYSYIDAEKLKMLNEADYFLSKYLVSPISLALIPTEEYINRVNDYKIKVFQKAMRLTPRELSELPMEVANIFVRAGYIPLDKILSHEGELVKLLK